MPLLFVQSWLFHWEVYSLVTPYLQAQVYIVGRGSCLAGMSLIIPSARLALLSVDLGAAAQGPAHYTRVYSREPMLEYQMRIYVYINFISGYVHQMQTVAHLIMP